MQMRHQVRVETNADEHGVDVDRSTMERAVEEEAKREREKLDRAHIRLAKLQAEKANQAIIQEARARRTIREMKHDVQMEEVSHRVEGMGR